MGGGYTEGVFLWLMEMAKRIVNEKEGESIEDVVDSDPGKGNTVDRAQTRISRAFVRVIRKMTPFARMTTAASVVGSRGAVGRVGRAVDCEAGSTVRTGWHWRLSIAFHTKARNGNGTPVWP